MNQTTEVFVCDCGHPESPHLEITRGYGRDENNKTMCYECCAEVDAKRMRETGKATLYLVKRENAYFVTNWPGSLSFPVNGNIKRSWHNMGRERRDVWFRFDGDVWHGYNIGDNDICHCRRTKGD